MFRSEEPLTDVAFTLSPMTWYVRKLALQNNPSPPFWTLSFLTLEGPEVMGGAEIQIFMLSKLWQNLLGITLFRCPDCVQQWKENADYSQKATSMS